MKTIEELVNMHLHLAIYAVPLAIFSCFLGYAIAKYLSKYYRVGSWEFIALTFVINNSLILPILFVLLQDASVVTPLLGFAFFRIFAEASLFVILFSVLTHYIFLRSAVVPVAPIPKKIKIFRVIVVVLALLFLYPNVQYTSAQVSETYWQAKAYITKNPTDIARAYGNASDIAFRQFAEEQQDIHYCSFIKQVTPRLTCMRLIEKDYYMDRKTCILGLTYNDPIERGIYQCFVQNHLDLVPRTLSAQECGKFAVKNFSDIQRDILNDIEAKCQ